MKFTNFIVIISALAAVRFGMILGGIIPPLASNSPENVAFSLAMIAMILYMGWSFSDLGLKKAAFKGFVVTAVTMAILCLAAMISQAMHRPLIGINLPGEFFLINIILVLAALSAENILLGILAAVLGAYARRIAKKWER